MKWIVLGENKGKINLVSKKEKEGERGGILPKGSYLTVEKEDTKFILRVDGSKQNEPYSPSPMIVDMELSPLRQDQKCQNIISAYRVKDISNRNDGLIDYIVPQLKARRANQKEVDIAMGNKKEGLRVFPATIHGGKNQLLMDENHDYITARLSDEMFFHQTLVCGKTGSGKTVALKYLAQYFIEELEGAVLAINVKEADLLKMDKPSEPSNPKVLEEWDMLDEEARGINNFIVYYPSSTSIHPDNDINENLCKKITLNVETLAPKALTGLLRGISDVGAQSLPDIFRYWKEILVKENNIEPTFQNFVDYFIRIKNQDRNFMTLNERRDQGSIVLHSGTCNNIQRNLNSARAFFDDTTAERIDQNDILQRGKMSVIDVTREKDFGSIILRDLLSEIVKSKSMGTSEIPILIIIDEVHSFYGSEESKEALGDLDTICRTGRSLNIGVVFSSQNPSDIPKGLSKVINSKIFFKSDAKTARKYGLKISSDEMESLQKGYAVASIHNMSQLKFLKFPLAYAGVFED